MENRNYIYAGLAALVVLILGVVFWPESQPITPAPIVIDEPAIEKLVIPAPVEDSVEEVLPTLPLLPPAPRIIGAPVNLNDSDEASRQAAADLSVQLGRWLIPAEQIRKWVVFMDRAADGELQSKHRPWGAKLGPYLAAGTETSPRTSRDNYARYNTAVNTINGIAVEKLAYYIDQWAPLFDEAYEELGRDGRFYGRVLLALDQVIAAEALASESQRLVQPSVMYKYADVRLESASDIEKLLWRMGPDNAAKLQSYARRLRATLQEPPEYQSNF